MTKLGLPIDRMLQKYGPGPAGMACSSCRRFTRTATHSFGKPSISRTYCELLPYPTWSKHWPACGKYVGFETGPGNHASHTRGSCAAAPTVEDGAKPGPER